MSGTVEAMLRDFNAAATAFCAAISTGDAKSANLYVDAAAEVYRDLRALGAAAQAALLELLESDDEAIRYMAAVHALDFAPEEGERVLTEITRGPPSPVSLLALTSLSQWRAGLLHF